MKSKQKNSTSSRHLEILAGAILFSIPLFFSSQAAHADRTDAIQAKSDYVQARQAEVNGQLEGARYGYSRVLSYALANCKPGENPAYVKVCGESLGSIGRRAIKLQVDLIRKEQSHPSGKYNIPTLENELCLIYRRMQTVEPQNPNWFYLEALFVCEKEHHYVKASRLLKRCLQCQGSSAVKAKAQKLLAHIKPTADKQLVWLQHDVKIAKANFKRFVESADFAKSTNNNYKHGDYGNKSESVPDWQRKANEAYARGDYEAAARFESGNSTFRDNANTW